MVYLTSCSLLASRMPDFSTAVPGLGSGLGLGLGLGLALGLGLGLGLG